MGGADGHGDATPGRARVALNLLGPVEALVDGRRVELNRNAHRRVVSLLATAPGRRIPTEQLIDRFWDGAPPSSAKTALQTHISAVRRILIPAVIATEGNGYVLDVDAVELDLVEFEATARLAREAVDAHRWHDALGAAARALELWRGEPFGEIPDDHAAIGARVRLTELQAGLAEGRAEALVAIGRLDEALPDLEVLVRDQPLRERSWELLALARWRLGRAAEAHRALHAARAALAEAGLVAGHGLRSVEQQIVVGEAPSAAATLPNPLTSFVGRRTERAQLTAHVVEHRLVTITGVGGAGKSRLAIEVARDLLERGDVAAGWFVELASIDDADHVPGAVAAAVGATDDGDATEAAIAAALAGRSALLVLDNCEHVGVAVGRLVRTLLESAPEARVLATSRINLGLTGELVYELPPMSTQIDGGDPGVMDAVRLFVDRARLARPNQEVGAGQGAVVAELCAELDGLPLAIELAAARTRTLSLETILARTADRLRLLRGHDPSVPSRQRTIEATIAWSYDLLDRDERLVLARLGVFRSPMERATIEVVCGDDRLDVDQCLDRLVAHSLVSVRADDDEFRYELLSSVREFAWARAAELDEVDRTVRAHLDHFTEMAAERAAARSGTISTPALDRGVAVDDMRAALDTARRMGDDRAVMLLGGLLGRIAELHDRWREALELFDIALQGDAGPQERLALRAIRATAAANVDIDATVLAEIRDVVEQLEELPRSAVLAGACVRSGLLHQLSVVEPTETSIPYFRRAVAVAADVGDVGLESRGRAMLASALAWIGDDVEALRASEAAVEQARRTGSPVDVIRALDAAVGVVFLTAARRRDGARAMSREALELAEQADVDGPLPIDWVTFGLMQAGDLEGAARGLELQLAGADLTSTESGMTFSARHVVGAYIAWFDGDLDRAAAHIDRVWDRVHARWFHDFAPVAAEVALRRGDGERVDEIVDRYLSAEVGDSEQVMKVGVLRAHTQLLVERALDADGADADRWAAAAVDTVEQMRTFIAASPLRRTGGLQIETPATWLALAEAELSRLDDDPAVTERVWREVADTPDFPWYRRYAVERAEEAAARR